MSRADVQEVDVEAVDLCHKQRRRVQFRLCLSPIVLRLPVAYEFPNLRQLRVLGVTGHSRPFGRRNALAKLNQRAFRNPDAKRANRGVLFGPRGLSVAGGGEQNQTSCIHCS